jgi:hypothetical protein
MPDPIFDIALSMSDAELFASIGEALEGGRAAPQDALQREGIGRRYFASLRPKLCSAICNQRIAALFGGSGSLAELAAAILDALRPHLAMLPDGAPLITIAVLAARTYAELCGGKP